MVQDVIDSLKNTENKATQIVASANRNAAEIVATSQEDAKKFKDKVKHEMEEEKKAIFEADLKDQKKQIREMEIAAEKEMALIDKSARRSIADAVKMVIERIRS